MGDNNVRLKFQGSIGSINHTCTMMEEPILPPLMIHTVSLRRQMSPLFVFLSLFFRARDESFLSKHDGITLDLIPPISVVRSCDQNKRTRPYISRHVVTTTKGIAIFQKYLHQC